jgi:cell division septum initiation protein DivIVA
MMHVRQKDYVSLQEEVKQLQGEIESLKASLKRKHDECTHNNVQTKSSRKKLENGSILTTPEEVASNRGEMVEEGDKFDNNVLNRVRYVSEKIPCPNCSRKYATRQSLRTHCTTHCQKKVSIEAFNKAFPPYDRL